MRLHLIVDYSFLYYKYTFQLQSGKMKRLFVRQFMQDDEAGTVEYDRDISQIYYSIREIEKFRKDYEKQGHDVTMSICFDMKSDRKNIEASSAEEAAAIENYKANRVKRLGDEDFINIQDVEKLLKNAGYNTYRIEGLEADDIVSYLAKNYADDFDYNIIITPDADLLVNINHKVGVSRFKVFKGYQNVEVSNFADYCSAEFKCNLPYNALMLYKCTCGDKSDGIDGIKGFGPKAFDKLVDYCENVMGIDWEAQGNYEATSQLLDNLSDYLAEKALNQAKISLSLVCPLNKLDMEICAPTCKSNAEMRAKSYMTLEMKSLID